MMSFDTHAAMDMITHSTGGFSYDTLARALISNKKAKAGRCLLKDCQEFCEYLESQGVIKRNAPCDRDEDVYYEYSPH
ncbi:TPA: hypothetical protein ACWSP4_005795 [Klebsiella pneumoniae]